MNRKLKKNSIDNKSTYWNDFVTLKTGGKVDENSVLHH